MFWRRNWILRVHMYLLSWRKTNFFCVISILSLNQISKFINLTCLHFIGCRNYIHKNSYKPCFISNSSHCSTTILSKHITSALTAVKYHVIKYSETAFSNSNVHQKLFWSHRKVASAKLAGFSSIFFRFFYFIHILATRSYQSKSVVSC